jgi:hypothetical protein
VSLPRTRRRWLSGWLIVALLFMQFATAAYACPRQSTAPQQVDPSVELMPGCAGHMPASMDPGQPQLCKAHCDQGNQSVGSPVSADVPASPLLLAVLDWGGTQLALAPLPGRALKAASGARPPGAAPLYLALLVLRN